MACYFHMRAIFLRAASKETRGKQESVREKQNSSSFRNMKSANMQLSAQGLLSAVQVLTLPLFGSNATSDGELGELSPTQSIPNIL